MFPGINFLKTNGSEVDSHMAPVSPEVYDEILLEFSKDKLQIERHRKEQARKVVVSKIQKKEADFLKAMRADDDERLACQVRVFGDAVDEKPNK